MDVGVMQQNGERLTAEELQPYRGMYVAFGADGRSIVACGDSWEALAADVAAKRLDPEQVWFDYIGGDEIEPGGTEFFQ